MIEIKPVSYQDAETDFCGSATVATLTIDKITIPLCMDCIDELSESLSKFNNTTFCYQCRHFIMSEYGWSYGGNCKKDKDIKPQEVGYKNPMDTCKNAVLR